VVIPNLLADTSGTPVHAMKELGAFPADAVY
jgi:hypothetical protein